MTCKKCGCLIDESMQFCPQCGSHLNEKQEGFLKKMYRKYVNYTESDLEREDSLYLFMLSCLKVGFILLILFSLYSALYQFLGIFYYFNAMDYLRSLFCIPYTIGCLILSCVGLRGYREIKKLDNDLKISINSVEIKEKIQKLFIGGFTFFGIMVIIFLN